MSGRRWLRASSASQWALVVSDTTTGTMANPTPSFSFTVDGLLAHCTGAGSFSTNGPVTDWTWDFGDGTTGSGPAVDHRYAALGDYTVRLSITDSIGRTAGYTRVVAITDDSTAGSSAPTARLTATASGLGVDFDASASSDPDDSITSYQFSFGDGSGEQLSLVPQVSHLYATTGAYHPSVTVTNGAGLTGSTALTVSVQAPSSGGSSSGSGTTAPYLVGSMYDGIPSTLHVYTLADLGLSTAVTNLQTIVDALPGPGLIQLPGNGWTGHIPNFSHHTTSASAGLGINSVNLRGFLGDISAGTMNTKIRVDPGALSAAQIAFQASNSSGTTQHTAIKPASGYQHAYAGLILAGEDLGTFTSSQTGRTGPVTWGGIGFYRPGANTIFQNNLLLGFGRADATSPPGEVGNWGEAHSVDYLFRRVEHDGRLPVGSAARPNDTAADPYGMGWRRGGGLQWNASTFLMEDVLSHDTWNSGVTMSFTSLPSSTANCGHDWTTRRLNIQGNAAWGTAPGNQNSTYFPLVNHEFQWGKIQHFQPRFGGIKNWGSWNNCHHRFWGVGTIGGVQYTADASFALEVYQPSFDADGTNPMHNDCYSVYYATNGLYTSFDGKTLGGRWAAPKVYYTADLTKPATAYVLRGSATLPSTITRANNYYVLCIS